MSGAYLYDRFAVVYDREWHPLATDIYRTVYQPVLRREVPRGQAVLDLCCGCGHVSAHLVADGYTVTGLDRSAPMLRMAARRNPGVAYVLGDVTRFRVAPPHAAAVACFDSLNYLRTRRQLQACFRCVRRAIRGAGLFLFDLGTRTAFERYWNARLAIRRPEYCCILEKSFRPAAGTGTLAITTFLRSGRVWRRFEESHLLRAWEPPDVVRALAQAGFQATAQDAYDGKPARPTSERVLIIARRG